MILLISTYDLSVRVPTNSFGKNINRLIVSDEL